LDDAEHAFKVGDFPSAQATPSLLWVGSGPRHDIAVALNFRWRVAAPGCWWQEIASGRAAIAIAAVRVRGP
jgi:maltoporin